MYEIPFKKMLQPRVAATWGYDAEGTVYASYAKYNPAASSLPRAASWDRNVAATINAYFDANGVLFATDPLASSSGKLFVEDLTPRGVDEFLVGTARQIDPHWSARLYGRYRKGSHFWEDTNNDARVLFKPPAGIPQELYIKDLAARRAQIGSGSSYVIAELDGAYSKYYEATVESEWRGEKTFVRGSYTWSHYYGNFDQDNSTVDNDLNIFIGSSNIADGAGRQLWDFKDGDLRGDRPHVLKIYGTRSFHWNGSVGPLRRRPVRTAVGVVELRALPHLDHLDQRDEPLLGTRGLAAGAVPLADRRQLHPELPGEDALQHPAHRGRLQHLQQADGVQLRAEGPQLGVRDRSALLRPQAPADGGTLPVLT